MTRDGPIGQSPAKYYALDVTGLHPPPVALRQ